MCTNFSILMNANWKRMHPEEAKRRWENAVMHISFCCEVYDMQMRAGRYFIHEHPLSASSWQLPAIRSLMDNENVVKTCVHMCAYVQAHAYRSCPILLVNSN